MSGWSFTARIGTWAVEGTTSSTSGVLRDGDSCASLSSGGWAKRSATPDIVVGAVEDCACGLTG